MRRVVRGFVTAAAVAHLLALATPVVMAAASATVAEDGLCTCPGGDHATCPMHHASSVRSARGECRMQATATPSDAPIVSMAFGLGLPTTSALGVVAPAPQSARCAVVVSPLASRGTPPEPPPPRG